MSSPESLGKKLDQVLSYTLTVNEIFYSIQGETAFTGLPTVFVRLTGCPLRCQYCDTEYAFNHGFKFTIKDILAEVSKFRSRYVTVTGGEPLAQKNCPELLSVLCDEGYQLSLETSGAIDISRVDERVSRILDIKTPASGEVKRNKYDNFKYLTDHDQIKFVICGREDYLWAKQLIQDHQLNERCEILMSPSHEQLDAGLLADWVLEDQIPVRIQVQLHKYLWGNVPGR